jgi:ABC-2 type transport system permease protein
MTSAPTLTAQPPLPALPAANRSALADVTQETLALTRRLFLQLARRTHNLVGGVL